MTVEPEQRERRQRRRFALLWLSGGLAVGLLIGTGVVVITRDDSPSSTRGAALEADGSGTAPVYDHPPVDLEPDPSSTSGTQPGPTGTRVGDGGDSGDDLALLPPAGTGTTYPVTGPGSTGARPHGVGLSLTSTTSGVLQPGVWRTLHVSVRNPNPFTVQLFRVDVRVQQPPPAGCLPSWVRVGRYRAAGGPAKKIAGSSTITVDLPIQLVNLPTVNQDACQGTTFPLTLSGIAADPA